MSKAKAGLSALGGHILFLNPPSKQILYRGVVCTWISKAKYLWQPFDFILLSALVPKTTKISYLNAFVHKLEAQDIIEFIQGNNVVHLVIAMSSIQWENDFDFVTTIRNKFPALSISVLGDVFQERYFVKHVLPLSVVIIRYPLDLRIAEYFKSGAITTPSLLKNLDSDSDSLPPVTVPGCVELPLPRHEIFMHKKHRSPFDKHKRSAIVNLSWGCPFKCAYCSWSSPYLPFAHKTARSVLSELEFLSSIKVKEIFFSDLSFGIPEDVCRDIINTMIFRNWNFSWHCYCRPGSISSDFLEGMSKAGCHTVMIGVEGLDTNLTKFNRNIPLQNIKETISLCHKFGIDVCGDFIIGLNETADSCKELVDFAIKLRLDYASFNIYTPLFGSLERSRKIEKGLLKEGEWGFDTIGLNKSLKNYSKNRRQCVRMFYARPAYLLKQLFKIKTRDEFLIKSEEAMHMLRKM